jgi:predicted dehydrogenase
MSLLRVAIVGCGKIADQHIAAIKRTGLAEIVGVCDSELLMAEQLADRNSIRHTSADLAQLIRDARPSIVHITTPPQSHFTLTTQCLEAGCHVYVEKPFTLNTEEALCLIRMAQAKGLKLTAGHNLQFTWESIEARELVKAGFLGGPPVHIESYYTYNIAGPGYAKALLGDRSHWVRRLPGKLLHNIISHGIARIAEFMVTDGPVIVARGYQSPVLRQIGETEVADELRVQVSDGANMTGSFVFSSQISPPINGVRLYGPTNSLFVDNVHHTLIRSPHTRYKSFLNYFIPPVGQAREHLRNSRRNIGRFLRSQFHDDSGLKSLTEAFYLAVRDEAPLPISYREIVLTSRIMDGIFAQLNPAADSAERSRFHAVTAED